MKAGLLQHPALHNFQPQSGMPLRGDRRLAPLSARTRRLTFAVLTFAVSTMISWAYYGLKGWTYLFGEGRINECAYKLSFCAVIVVGTAVSFSAVIDLSDAALFAMSICNIIGLYLLMPVVKAHCGKAHAQWLRMHDTQVDGLRPAITSAPRSAIATEVAELAMPAMPDEIERRASASNLALAA